MSEFRLSRDAEAELDGIWIRIARESGSIDVATRVVEGIVERFWMLARYPYIGRRRDHDLRSGLRSLIVDDYVVIHTLIEDDIVLSCTSSMVVANWPRCTTICPNNPDQSSGTLVPLFVLNHMP